MDDPTKAIKEARALSDPAQRAKALGEILGPQGLPTLTKQLQKERQAAVVELHDAGMSWAEVGEAIGQHRTRASQIAKGISGGKRKAA